jgi:hypothetical protein
MGRVTAEEARKRSTTIKGARVKKQLDEIDEMIDNAIRGNKLFISVEFSFEDLTTEDLESRGFTLKHIHGTQHDPESYTTISW